MSCHTAGGRADLPEGEQTSQTCVLRPVLIDVTVLFSYYSNRLLELSQFDGKKVPGGLAELQSPPCLGSSPDPSREENPFLTPDILHSFFKEDFRTKLPICNLIVIEINKQET